MTRRERIPFGGAVDPVHAWHAWWNDRPRSGALLRTAASRGFVLDSGQLAALGITRGRARTLTTHAIWSIPRRGVIAPLSINDDEPDDFTLRRREHAMACAAAALRRPGEVVAQRSAAILHGLPTLHIPARPQLVNQTRLALVAPIPPRDGVASISRWFGVPVTTVERTVVDLARHDRQEGIMAADAALRSGMATTFDIELALARRWPGVKAARDVLALASPKSESPLESITRLALHDTGFPPPELQYWIAGFWVDFCWPGLRLVLEADGRGKYSDDALWQEKLRQTAVSRARYDFERVIWSDVMRAWPATTNRLRAYFP